MIRAPSVSVVASVYQGAAYLRASLESVLSQEGVDFELIVVDDGSTDGSAAILDRLATHDRRMRVLRQENRGLTNALMRACAEARGQFIARHDVDDLSLEGRLELQAQRLHRDPGLSFVASWTRVLGPRDEPLYEIKSPSKSTKTTTTQFDAQFEAPTHGSVMFRTAAYRQAGGYREAFRYAQDHDLWLRLGEVGQFDCVPEFLYSFRVGEASISAQRRSQQLRLAALARRCASARRAGEPEAPWLEEAAQVSAEPRPARGARDPGNSYFIGKCLLDRRDVRCLGYLRRAVRDRPTSWRAWAAWLWAQPLRWTTRPMKQGRA